MPRKWESPSLFTHEDSRLEAVIAIREACLADHHKKIRVENLDFTDSEVLNEAEKEFVREVCAKNEGKNQEAVLPLIKNYTSKVETSEKVKAAPAKIEARIQIGASKNALVEIVAARRDKIEKAGKNESTPKVDKINTPRAKKPAPTPFRQPILWNSDRGVDFDGKYVSLFGCVLYRVNTEKFKRIETTKVTCTWTIGGRVNELIDTFDLPLHQSAEDFKKAILGSARQLILCYLQPLKSSYIKHPADTQ